MLKKPYTNMNTGLWNKNKKWFWKILFLRIEIFMNKPVYLGISILEFSKYQKRNCGEKQNCVVWIHTVSLYT